MQMTAESPALIFDGDCAFCTRCADWLRVRLTQPVTVVPWQHTDLAALGVSETRAQNEVIWAERGGGPEAAPIVVRGGARAIAAALGRCQSPALRGVGRALDLPPLRWLAPPVYRLVARNRHRLPGGTPACALQPPAAGSRG